MAKEVVGTIKLQLPAGQATPAPPVGPALGQHGVNLGQFVKDYNDRTRDQAGYIIPVEISVYADRSFSFVTKTPPASSLLKRAANIVKGCSENEYVGVVSRADVEEIAKTKAVDLNSASMEAACRMVEGTARSMGIEVTEDGVATVTIVGPKPVSDSEGDFGDADGDEGEEEPASDGGGTDEETEGESA